MVSIREIVEKPQKLACGHRLCPGCGAGIVVNLVLSSVDRPVVVANATGCLEVSTTVYPYTSWNTPFSHSAFENAAATRSGVEGAYKALKRRGEVTEEDITTMASITVRHGKGKKEENVKVEYWKIPEEKKETVTVSPMKEQTNLEDLRI